MRSYGNPRSQPIVGQVILFQSLVVFGLDPLWIMLVSFASLITCSWVMIRIPIEGVEWWRSLERGNVSDNATIFPRCRPILYCCCLLFCLLLLPKGCYDSSRRRRSFQLIVFSYLASTSRVIIWYPFLLANCHCWHIRYRHVTYFNCGVTRIITRHRFSVLLASSSRLRILIKSSLLKGHFALSQIGLNLPFQDEVVLSFSLVEVNGSIRSRPLAASTLAWTSLKRVWQWSSAGVRVFRFAENRFFDPGMECSPSCSCRWVLRHPLLSLLSSSFDHDGSGAAYKTPHRARVSW